MVAVILESHSIVYVCLYVGMFVWLMVTLASSSAICRTINPTEKIDRAKKGRHRHTHTHTHTHTQSCFRELNNAAGNNNKAAQL